MPNFVARNFRLLLFPCCYFGSFLCMWNDVKSETEQKNTVKHSKTACIRTDFLVEFCIMRVEMKWWKIILYLVFRKVWWKKVLFGKVLANNNEEKLFIKYRFVILKLNDDEIPEFFGSIKKKEMWEGDFISYIPFGSPIRVVDKLNNIEMCASIVFPLCKKC